MKRLACWLDGHRDVNGHWPILAVGGYYLDRTLTCVRCGHVRWLP